jgi:PAS domain S-box-containing protein
MRQSEERYRLLAENIPQLVWTSHTDGTIDYVNRRVAEYVGPEHQERRLWDWDRIVHPADLALALDRWRNALLTGKTYEAEFRLRRADGVYRSHMVRAVPVRGSHNRITQWLGTCSDIEEHRTLESQFRQSQKMEAIGQLASGVAHDFNNLLTVILGYSELMLGRLTKDDPGRELVAAVQRAGEQASALTGQLLAFSRKQVLAPRVIDLNGILANMQAMLRRLIGEDVDLHTKLDPGLLPVHADPGQLEQLVMNLAVNARDAMPHGGKLTIETRNVKVGETGVDLPSGPYVLLAVSDTGTGMTKEVRDHLFEPFFTTKEPGRGTGLGLATVFGIVKQSGGHITTQSEPGVGSTFLIYLPPAPSFPTPAPKSVLNIRRASMGTETLLLVEDDHAVRTLSRQVLAQSGYRVLEASGSSQALSIAAAHKAPIHLLVTDVVMPGQSGRVLAEQLTRLHPETSVLYLSGYTDDAVVRRGIVQAHVNFLQKPYSPGTFVRKVRNVLDEPRTN